MQVLYRGGQVRGKSYQVWGNASGPELSWLNVSMGWSVMPRVAGARLCSVLGERPMMFASRGCLQARHGLSVFRTPQAFKRASWAQLPP